MTQDHTPALSGEELDLPPPDVIGYTCIGENDAYSPALVRAIVQDAQARAARQSQPVDAGVQAATSAAHADAAIQWAQVAYRNDDSFDRRELDIVIATWAEAMRRAALAQAAPADLTDEPMRACEDCDGSGRLSPQELCARCDASGILPAARAAVVAIPAPAELSKAFITLESSGEQRTIVLKFNQRQDAYAVHDFLLKAGGKDYRFAAPAAQAQPAGAPTARAASSGSPMEVEERSARPEGNACKLSGTYTDLRSLKEQSEAWMAIYSLLNDLRPNWQWTGKNGRESALDTIREFARAAQPAGAGAPSIDTDEFRTLLFCFRNAPFSNGAREKAQKALTAHIDAQLARQGAAPADEATTYTVDGVTMSPIEYIAHLHEQINAARQVGKHLYDAVSQGAAPAQAEPVGYIDTVSKTFYPCRISVDKYADRPDRVKPLYFATAPAHAGVAQADELHRVLTVAEAALGDIGDADREEGDDLEWCEKRAAEALPRLRQYMVSVGLPISGSLGAAIQTSSNTGSEG